MINPHQQETGDIYLCLKANKKQGTVKGKYYVYDSGELKTFTTRNVTMLCNGDDILWKIEEFELAKVCPFCATSLKNVDGSRIFHDGVECASAWDRRVKNYE